MHPLVTPLAEPLQVCLAWRGSAFQCLQLGLELADAHRKVPDKVLPALGAHAPAENVPCASGKLDVMVAGGWPTQATFATADADVAPAKVDDLHGGIAVGAWVERHATATPPTVRGLARPDSR